MADGVHPAVGNRSIDDFGGGSRPPKNNCTTADRVADASELPGGPAKVRRKWWSKKNEIVSEFLKKKGSRANRPISVRSDTKIREECAQEKHVVEGRYRARPWSAVLREFLTWYNGYRHSHLVFRDPDGNKVRSQMRNSHMPEYGNKYYARLKGLERQITREYDDLHICMLTFTGTMKNDMDGWRCPADHWRDVVSSWRPDRGRGVYHTLRDVLDGLEWEYALVAEHHKNGYGHVHVAVFVDGEITERMFHPVIDAHLRICDIAGPEAHNYNSENVAERPISVSSVDTSLEPGSEGYAEELESIGNIGSYIAEYIASHGKELLERDTSELMFRSVCWATGTQRVRFSTGANEMIDADRDRDDYTPRESCGWKIGTSQEHLERASKDPEQSVSDYVDGERKWSIEGVGRIDDDGEDIYTVEQSGVRYVTIDDGMHLDVPKKMPSKPIPRGKS